jgi:hypothetical protein
MTPTDCETIRDNIDAWALGALEPDEAHTVEAHLNDCAVCSAAADDAREAAAALALLVPVHRANAAVKPRLLALAGVLDDVRRRRVRPRPWWSAAAAAAVFIGVGLVGWNAYLQNQLDDVQDESNVIRSEATQQSHQFATLGATISQQAEVNQREDRARDAAHEIESQPDVQRIPLEPTSASSPARARYVWSPTAGKGALFTYDLPQLPRGRSYCMWLVRESGWQYGGLFEVNEDGNGRLVVDFQAVGPSELGALRGFAITVERDQLVTTHSGPTVLATRFD